MRKLLAAAVVTLAVLGVAAPAAAGGWAVTTLDPLAAAPVAGEPFEVGFTIRQHGQTPITVDDAAIIVTDSTGTATRFAAEPDGARRPPRRHRRGARRRDVPVGRRPGLRQSRSSARCRSARPRPPSAGDGSSPWTVPLFLVAAVLAGLGLVDLGRGTLARRRHAVPVLSA